MISAPKTSTIAAKRDEQQNPPIASPKGWLQLWVLVIVGTLLLVVVLSFCLLAFHLRYRNLIVPGIWSSGIPLGGFSQEAAALVLQERFSYPDDAVFTFRYEDRFWQLTARELGVTLDSTATAQQAYNIGHTGSVARDLLTATGSWLNGRSIAPVVLYNQATAIQQLQIIAAEVDRPPLNATLNLTGLTVDTTPGSVGRRVNILATLRMLEQQLLTLSTGSEIMIVVQDLLPDIRNTEAAAVQIQTALSGPLMLRALDQNGQVLGPWTVTVDQIASLLRVELITGTDGFRNYAVSVDMSAFEAALQTLAPGLIIGATDGRFQFNESTGQLEVLVAARMGRTLNIPETLARMEAAVFTTHQRTFELVFNNQQPRYHNTVTASELGITGLVSQATTYYRGSTEARRLNIAQAASRFDGIIIGPGEEFSYNYWLGDVSPEAGFAQALVIQGDRTVLGIGGGVCQVSTTAYQAAFYAGFPIVERYPHAYRVGYYELGEGPGMDAAIYTPEYDFRFLNDTPYHLLIDVELLPAQEAITFRFYSTNPGRRVVRETPQIVDILPPGPTVYVANSALSLGVSQQVDWPVEGATISVTRIIQDVNGNELDRDTFTSRYAPWGAVIEVAPGDPRLGGG